jgi:hypothetical protein
MFVWLDSGVGDSQMNKLLILQRKFAMAVRRKTLAELAMRQQMHAATRSTRSGWFERHGAIAGMVGMGVIVLALVWRILK